MRLFTMGAFWGVLVILFGISILLKAIFNINIPLFRVAIGILVISWGVSIIFGMRTWQTENTIVFGNTKFESAQLQKEYNIVFGTGIIDLSATAPEAFPDKIKVNTVFSDTRVYIPAEMQVTVQGSCVFGNITLPNDKSVSFGSMSQTLGGGTKNINLNVDTVFGQTRILYK